MKEIVHSFKHIARDFMIYILPGLIIVIYGLYFSSFKSYFEEFENNDRIINICSILIASYIIGHCILGIMEGVFVCTKIADRVQRIFFKRDTEIIESYKCQVSVTEQEIIAFKERESYDFFVERYNQLSLFRWNLSGAFLINGLIALYEYFFGSISYFNSLSLIFFFLFIFLFYLSIKTEIDGDLRRKSLVESLKKQ